MSAAVRRVALALLLAGAAVFAQALAAPSVAHADTMVVVDHDPSALVVFRSELDPYGVWFDHPRYGTVWMPNPAEVGTDFAPYVTNGRWALAEDGDWMWVSDYPFGWAVFHYGRWVWSSDYGWVWIPGREYSHAWVVWRVPSAEYAYVGWAPAPPSYVWVDGYAMTVWYRPTVPYVFCESRYVFHHHVHAHVIHDPHRVHYIATGTHRYVPPIEARRRAPTSAIARVPDRYLPPGRTPANPRATAMAARPGASGRVPARPGPAVAGRRATASPAVASSSTAGAPRLGAAAPAGGRAGARPSSRAIRSLGYTSDAGAATSTPAPSPLLERRGAAAPAARPAAGAPPARPAAAAGPSAPGTGAAPAQPARPLARPSAVPSPAPAAAPAPRAAAPARSAPPRTSSGSSAASRPTRPSSGSSTAPSSRSAPPRSSGGSTRRPAARPSAR